MGRLRANAGAGWPVGKWAPAGVDGREAAGGRAEARLRVEVWMGERESHKAGGGTADAAAAAPRLTRDEAGLALVGGNMVLRGDFSRMLPRLRRDRLSRELLVRAAKVKGVDAPVAVDATAGLGEDSLLLAAAGFSVLLCERDEVVAALLKDALERAAADPALAAVVARMRVAEGDSIEVLHSLPEPPDVVYLDPMFPERRKSAAVKTKFQLIHQLEPPCGEQEELLGAALAASPRKVVIKRPVKGPALAGVKPSYSLCGKAVRYDVLVPPR